MKNNRKGVIYSTNPNYKFETEEEENIYNLTPKEQNLKIYLENRKSNKSVVIIKGFIGKKSELKNLAKFLKNQFAVGGSIKDGNIIIQTKERKKIIKNFENKGYKCTRIGG